MDHWAGTGALATVLIVCLTSINLAIKTGGLNVLRSKAPSNTKHQLLGAWK